MVPLTDDRMVKVCMSSESKGGGSRRLTIMLDPFGCLSELRVFAVVTLALMLAGISFSGVRADRASSSTTRSQRL